jgi:hypothetical protein
MLLAMMEPRKRRSRDLPRVGWREWVALPDLGVERIKAKIDTGARTSSLHAFDIRRVVRGGRRFVRFKVHPRQRDASFTVEARAPLIAVRRVRSSSGHVTERPVILTDVAILDQRWEIELTLIARDEMGFRMLLGRQAVRNRFLVDAGRSHVANPRPKRRDKDRR